MIGLTSDKHTPDVVINRLHKRRCGRLCLFRKSVIGCTYSSVSAVSSGSEAEGLFTFIFLPLAHYEVRREFLQTIQESSVKSSFSEVSAVPDLLRA